jgi:hypothetical protein
MKCQEGRKLTLCQVIERTHEGIQMNWPHKNSAEVLIQHDNARLQTYLKYQQAITQFGWPVLTHIPCSPDVTPGDFQLFGALKDAVCGGKFETNNDVICAVKTWLHEQDKANMANTSTYYSLVKDNRSR